MIDLSKLQDAVETLAAMDGHWDPQPYGLAAQLVCEELRAIADQVAAAYTARLRADGFADLARETADILDAGARAQAVNEMLGPDAEDLLDRGAFE